MPTLSKRSYIFIYKVTTYNISIVILILSIIAITINSSDLLDLILRTIISYSYYFKGILYFPKIYTFRLYIVRGIS